MYGILNTILIITISEIENKWYMWLFRASKKACFIVIFL